MGKLPVPPPYPPIARRKRKYTKIEHVMRWLQSPKRPWNKLKRKVK